MYKLPKTILNLHTLAPAYFHGPGSVVEDGILAVKVVTMYLGLLLIGDDKLGFEQIIIIIIFNTYTLKESLTVIGWSFASEYCLPWSPKI